MKTFTLAILLALAPAASALDANMEQRCKDIDAQGVPNACLCSEPLITNDTIVGHSWNPRGSVTKQCGPGGIAIYKQDGPANGDVMVPLTGAFSAPGGVPYGYRDAHVNGANGTINGYNGSISTNVGRVCHRVMFRLSSDFQGNGGTCQSVKAAEMNPNPRVLGMQYQAGWGGTDPNLDMYFTGQADTAGGGAFSNVGWPHIAPIHGAACKNNWCAVEQCWHGNFSTGAIQPIGRLYATDPSTGATVIDALALYEGQKPLAQTFAVPVTWHMDAIANMYRANNGSPGCQGSRVFVYAMEAAFAVADDGTSAHGPWIGPPVEFTGGNSPSGIGIPGRPFLVP